MKNKRSVRVFLLLCVLVLPLVLSGCYANTPTIEGIGGDYPDFPTPSVEVQVSPTVDVINDPSASPDATQAVSTENTAGVISIQTSVPVNTVVVLNHTTIGPVTPAPTVITATSSSTPTPSNILKKGVNGNNVRELQSKLKELGYYKGTVDGDFGEATETAVKAFQKDYNLTQDGIAGIETLRRLANARATAKPTATPTPAPTSRPSYSENTYLRLGSSGSLVTRLQERLISLGYLSGKATGEFDSITEAAVIAFQKRNTSYWDGVAGKLTLDALFSSNAKGTSTSAGMIGASLQRGSTGSEVRSLQSRLKALGYYTGTVDGSFGASTEDAVKAFQRNNSLTADGKAGNETLQKLNSSSAVSADRTESPYHTLSVGNEGASVTRLQNRLKALGYFKGTVDGSFGASTEAAVKAFQRENNLTVDGKAGAETQSLLYSSSAKSSPNSNTLEKGSTGSAVSRLQDRLKALGYYSGSSDGSFGNSTEEAVKAFQRRNNLTADGKAGTATLEKLYSSSAVAAEEDVLQEGSSGTEVTVLQNRLKALGYYNDTVDGNFGAGTKAAVEAFQRRNGLTVDGKVGENTAAKLYASSAITASLRVGDTGSDVSRLQSRLRDLGYYKGSVDGTFGNSTEEAVKAFQRRNNLTVDGMAGYVTQEKLYSNSAIKAPTATPAPTQTPYPDNVYILVTPAPDGSYVTLRKGNYGDLVLNMQQNLMIQGYYSGELDAYFGQATEDAVKAFQRKKGLYEDGVAGPATLQVLFEGNFPEGS